MLRLTRFRPDTLPLVTTTRIARIPADQPDRKHRHLFTPKKFAASRDAMGYDDRCMTRKLLCGRYCFNQKKRLQPLCNLTVDIGIQSDDAIAFFKLSNFYITEEQTLKPVFYSLSWVETSLNNWASLQSDFSADKP